MRILLAQLREQKDMTQTQLSRSAKISQGYYSDIESGFRSPSPEVAERIAKVLSIPEKDMFRVFYSEQ